MASKNIPTAFCSVVLLRKPLRGCSTFLSHTVFRSLSGGVVNTGQKKTSQLQGSHADMASRMDYLENLLADREMQEDDIELESAEEEREEKKGNGIKEVVSEDDDASDQKQ